MKRSAPLPGLLFRLLLFLLFIPGFRAASARDVVFAGYNIENYAPVAEPGKPHPGKSEAAAAAVVAIVRKINPDVLGVCEMGPRVQFKEFRRRLAAAGLGYTDFEFVEAADPDRHLALVSRFPIVARQSLTDVSFEADGTREKVRRGFLDVTIAVGDRRLRIVGTHLKSKLASRDGDGLLRRNEAHLLRGHLEQILADDPAANLLVYGDFNDTRDQPALREVAGRRGSPDALTALPLADSVGDRWTHYWKVDDVYSRIDFLFVSRALSRMAVRSRCYIYRGPDWNDASDHRPVVAIFHFPKS